MSTGGTEGKAGVAVPVTIFGQAYTLRTEDDPSYVESLAEYVDGRMREVADLTRTADTAKIAILAALNIADELRKRDPGRDDVERRIAVRTEQIESLLDAALS